MKEAELNFGSMFDGIMGRIAAGLCRLGMNGGVAIKTSNGYKIYNQKSKSLTDCSQFVLDIGDDLFMVIPTRSLKKGDIALLNGQPHYILDVKEGNRVETLCYETAEVKTMIPEHHILMSRKFYGKIVSLVGGLSGGKNNFLSTILKLKMFGALSGDNSSASNVFGVSNPLMLMMLMKDGGMDNLFDGLNGDGDFLADLCGDDDDSAEKSESAENL